MVFSQNILEKRDQILLVDFGFLCVLKLISGFREVFMVF